MDHRSKKVLIAISKFLISAGIAFFILNSLAWIYRGGYPNVVNETMSTSVCHVPYSFYSDMTEGMTFGFYDQNGFNNSYPPKSEIGYLIMGSSHMEAREVMPDQCMAYCFNELLNSGDNEGYAYNIGISGQRLPECISRIEYATAEFDPQKAIIIETSDLDFPREEVYAALQGVEIGELMYSDGGVIAGLIRKQPYVRLAYIQISSLKNPEKELTLHFDENSSSNFYAESYYDKMFPLIERSVMSSKGLPVIIVYHPAIAFSSDGSIHVSQDDRVVEEFCRICESQGVGFINMSDRFIAEYEENSIVPYGFSNTHVGSGHLNKYGHKMIAEELFDYVKETLQ